MASFSDDLDGMCADIEDILSDCSITITNATGGNPVTVDAIRAPRAAFDAGGAGMDRGEWIVRRASLGGILPLGGYRVTDNAGGAAVTYIVGRDDVSLEVSGKQVRIKATRMKGTGA